MLKPLIVEEPPVTDLLTPKQVAEYLQVSESTVRHWMCRRILPYCQLVGTVRILRSDLDAWVRSRRITSLSTERELAGQAPNVAVTNVMSSRGLEVTLADDIDASENSRFFGLARASGEQRRIIYTPSHNCRISLHLRQYHCTRLHADPRHLRHVSRRYTSSHPITRVQPPDQHYTTGRWCAAPVGGGAQGAYCAGVAAFDRGAGMCGPRVNPGRQHAGEGRLSYLAARVADATEE